ncbi:hypothetical protein [Micropruina sp.]|uniref:hypothetical protein n=1 Tax=Micropruina sp. TaxID=2737536 RepID=UPI0039E41E02
MRNPALVAAIAALSLLGGCVEPAAAPSPSASVTQVGLDLTEPGQARSMLRKLIAKAGTPNLIQVEITEQWAAITVVKDGQPETWAWRDDTIKQVDTDVVYVKQTVFSIDDFNINDVGALFRAAESISSSQSNQELQIVDSSAGEVFMSVSTNPESRTVFFYPDGALLPTLDFNTSGGISQGLSDVIGSRASAIAIGIQSTMGAWLDYAGSTSTTVRRLRTATVPVTINERSQRPELPLFSAARVDPEAIWRVLQAARQRDEFEDGTRWEVTIDERSGVLRMYFTIGSKSLVTDLDGQTVER